jgi:hypothetical protein
MTALHPQLNETIAEMLKAAAHPQKRPASGDESIADQPPSKKHSPSLPDDCHVETEASANDGERSCIRAAVKAT